MSAPEKPIDISLDALGEAKKRAGIDGVVAGTCAGFLSGFLSTKAFKMSRNTGLLSGLMAGSFVGYIFTVESLKLHVAKARTAQAELHRHLMGESADDMMRGERGVGGLEGLEDKYQTTRGDH
ncbi:hypothetical protein OF846_003652 [Rhodotorula toruloides]|nr:hypothetical protein OF846_003652 [Rhodotorula toruloides]